MIFAIDFNPHATVHQGLSPLKLARFLARNGHEVLLPNSADEFAKKNELRSYRCTNEMLKCDRYIVFNIQQRATLPRHPHLWICLDQDFNNWRDVDGKSISYEQYLRTIVPHAKILFRFSKNPESRFYFDSWTSEELSFDRIFWLDRASADTLKDLKLTEKDLIVFRPETQAKHTLVKFSKEHTIFCIPESQADVWFETGISGKEMFYLCEDFFDAHFRDRSIEIMSLSQGYFAFLPNQQSLAPGDLLSNGEGVRSLKEHFSI